MSRFMPNLLNNNLYIIRDNTLYYRRGLMGVPASGCPSSSLSPAGGPIAAPCRESGQWTPLLFILDVIISAIESFTRKYQNSKFLKKLLKNFLYLFSPGHVVEAL